MAIHKPSLDITGGKICAEHGFITVEIIEPVSRAVPVSKPRPAAGKISITLANGACIALEGDFDLSDMAQLASEIAA